MAERQATYNFEKECIVIQVVSLNELHSFGRTIYFLYGFNIYPKPSINTNDLFLSICSNLKFYKNSTNART